ncbi:MAG TPA: type 4a pilus biogenesis protein PilO [Candidatus Polarisedimenticolia bacterium]|jgi:Tfp pilus assembly protein PilO
MSGTRKYLADFDVREKAGPITVLILVWLGLNLAFAFVVNVPRGRRVTSLDEAVAEAGSALSRKEQEVGRLRDHFNRVIEGRASLDRFYGEVLSTKRERLISFQREIREIARQFNISVETITYPRESYPKDKVTKFSATMPLTGSYENLRQFIDTIERNPNFIVVEQIELTNSKEGGIILSLAIQLSTYFLDPDQSDQELAGGGRRG